MSTSALSSVLTVLGSGLAMLSGHLLAADAPIYSWQREQAKVLPTGDLEWKPETFRYEAGSSVRFIDFAVGTDDADGASQKTAWKHHPWDPAATGKAKAESGIHTYVFKRGVTYRGHLIADDSGEAGNPIRLTSDPTWGSGEATIVGSEQVSGWKRGATNTDIPEADKVWVAELDYSPRSLWLLGADATVTSIPLARTPNWTVSDPEDVMSEWYEWEQPKWWEDKNKATVKGKTMHQGVDGKNVTRDPSYYQDALVWTEWGIVMGTPFPTKVEAVDTDKHGLAFQGPWWGDSGKIITRNRYFLEDKPHYLDAPGEFWFERTGKGDGGRLHLRLPGDADPNGLQIEAAKRYSLIEDRAAGEAPPRLDIIGEDGRAKVITVGVQHLVISGLGFRFMNQWWDLEYPDWMHKEVSPAAIRLRGTSDDVRISNCTFQHVIQAVQISPVNNVPRNDQIIFCDNDISFTSDGAIHIGKGGGWLGDAKVLRNRLHMIGLRPCRQSSAHALEVAFPLTMEVAGNILTRCYGAGVFVHGGKGGNSPGDVPFSRNLIYQNKAEQCLLAANDWGAIEAWQSGPTYIYNNLAANPNGLWNWNVHKEFNARLGYAYYLDGGFKAYLFNNIAWGLSNDGKDPHCNQAAFQEAVQTYHNAYFNNTIYRFARGSNWSPAGGHHRYLGNVWSDISNIMFDLGQLKEDKSPSPVEYPHELMAFGANVFHKIASYGHFENLVPVDQKSHATFESFQAALAKQQALDASLGTSTDQQPLRDPANRDLRLASGSAAIDHGVRFFVPWGLYGMVGEWNFYPTGNDPAVIPDEHWYLADYFTDRATYYTLPQYPLQVVNVAADSYVAGPLEDWTKGALTLNGKDRFARVDHATMTKPVVYEAKIGKKEKETRTVEGEALKTPDIHTSNLLIEIHVRTEPGHTGGILVQKFAGTGYTLTIDGAGKVAFTLQASADAKASLTSAAAINDGKWHHVIAEADRTAKTLTIYLDGTVSAQGAGLGPMSLSNSGDLLVGGSPAGTCLAGTIEFLRICQGTLADARTTIGELYAWEFAGPQTRDFAGKAPTGKSRDAGALEFTDP